MKTGADTAHTHGPPRSVYMSLMLHNACKTCILVCLLHTIECDLKKWCYDHVSTNVGAMLRTLAYYVTEELLHYREKFQKT